MEFYAFGFFTLLSWYAVAFVIACLTLCCRVCCCNENERQSEDCGLDTPVDAGEIFLLVIFWPASMLYFFGPDAVPALAALHIFHVIIYYFLIQ